MDLYRHLAGIHGRQYPMNDKARKRRLIEPFLAAAKSILRPLLSPRQRHWLRKQAVSLKLLAPCAASKHVPDLAPAMDAQQSMVGGLQIYRGYEKHELSILSEFQDLEATPTPGFITDFIGTKISIDIVWKQAATLNGQVLPLPIPADFHAEAVEWLGVLKAVKSAKKTFSVIELGAGFGTWAISSAVAARHKGIPDIRVHMVEGDPRHCESAVTHFRVNGFANCSENIIHAAVGAQDGMARWPKMAGPASSDGWNNRPDFDNSGDYLGRVHDEMMDLRVISMKNLLARERIWDLVHIDVQGHEVEIVQSCIEDVRKKVRWIVVGTHSRKLDGDFIDLMHRAGWVLENEKPSRFVWDTTLPTLEAMTVIDGTQVWRNPNRL